MKKSHQTKASYLLLVLFLVSSFLYSQAQVSRKEPTVLKGKNKADNNSSRQGVKINTVLAGSCDNLDFESGNYTGWTGGIGYNGNTHAALTITSGAISTLGVNSAETSCSFHTLVNTGTDPYSGLPMVDPGGGTWACRIGGEFLNLDCDAYNANSVVYPYYGTPAPPNISSCYSNDPNTDNTASPNFGEAFSNGESIQQTFAVTSANCLFSYNYAVVISDAPHTGTENPYFSVQVFDQAGTLIPCLSYFIEDDTTGAGGVPPGFSTATSMDQLGNSVLYTPWTLNSLNLQPYIGTNVTVKFTAAGCTQGGHFCYAYIDCSCAPLALILPSGPVCLGGTQTITGPPNGIGGTYAWTGPGIVSGAATQTITANQAGTYSVTITNQKGCAYTLDTSITFYPNPTVTVNNPSNCAGGTQTLTATSTGNAGTLTYSWNPSAGLTFSPGDSVATTNPTVNTSYTVTGISTHGCTNTAVANVSVNTPVAPTFSAPAVCNGSPTVFNNTTTGGSIYNWNFGDATNPHDTSSQQNPTYTYPAAGSYVVSLTVTTSAGCKAQGTETVTVNPFPTLGFTANNPCDGSPVNFTNTTTNQAAIADWSWNLGDGSAVVTTTTPAAYTYSATNCYQVVLTATATTGCTGSFSATVGVYPNPVPYFTAFYTCFGDSSEFVDSSFVLNPTSGCINDHITSWNWSFGDGGISNSSLMTPDTLKHLYADCGPYNITLTVTTNNNCTANGTLSGDTVFCLPHVTVPPSFSICPGMATASQTFTSTVTNGGPAFTVWYTNYPVTNTGMTIADTLGFDVFPSYNTIPQNTSCVPVSDILYGVAVSNYCIGDTDSLKITVYPTPVVSPMPDDSACANQTVTIPNFTTCPVGSVVSWTNNANPSIGLAANGTGNINPFTGSNTTSGDMNGVITADATLNGCTGPAITFTVIVNPIPTMVASGTIVCPGDNVPSPTIGTTPLAGVNYNWTVSNNTGIGMLASGTGLPASYTAPTNTTLVTQTGIITYTPTLNGCVGPIAKDTVQIKPTPLVDHVPSQFWCPNQVTTPVNFVCLPSSGTAIFTYTIGGLAITSTGSVPSFTTVNTSGITTVLTVSVNATLNNCPGPDSTFNITVYPNPVANFSASSVCENRPMNFTDLSTPVGGISNWNWYWNNTMFSTVQNAQYPIATPSGSNTVTLIISSNTSPKCTDTVNKQVYVNPNPVAAFSGVNRMGCPNVLTAFTDLSTPVDSIQSWAWNFGNGQTFNGQLPPPQIYTNISATTPKYYSVSLIIKTDGGCIDTAKINDYIEVYPRPIANFSWGPNTADFNNPAITFVNGATGASEYTATTPPPYGQYGVQYYLGDPYATNTNPNSVDNNTSFNHSYNYVDPNDMTQTYYVTQWVINQYGCTDSITQPVEILPVFTFYIPNAFTPNGDGKNEGFKGIGEGIDNSTYNLWVFDRWGLMIFYSADINKAWDGHMRGNEGAPVLQEDVYVWLVKFNDAITHAQHEYHGTVTLVK